ncbi:unnamed protein product [Vitrella brassicaformis CCMP3155]|uniref:Uncharacterized protein n=1 Tax=Vitrella brassicaformis (strain CCMP3155) TaxID=1169540 RepID=A0A0G4EHJ3_VITBC|nr:unnamed protein product [Vitrella brassicaformis CCMP3155]|eukprot:CEL95368.1 unnamed protein product [Vitrella brassicaformis CCMP3155]
MSLLPFTGAMSLLKSLSFRTSCSPQYRAVHPLQCCPALRPSVPAPRAAGRKWSWASLLRWQPREEDRHDDRDVQVVQEAKVQYESVPSLACQQISLACLRSTVREFDLAYLGASTPLEAYAKPHSPVATLHRILFGHLAAITSLVFLTETDPPVRLYTTSIEGVAFLWDVERGIPLRHWRAGPIIGAELVCVDLSSPVVAFITADGNFHCVDVNRGDMINKLQLGGQLRCLAIDDVTGSYAFCGGLTGRVTAVRIALSPKGRHHTIRATLTKRISKGSLTCLSFVGGEGEHCISPGPFLIANTTDASLVIVDCVYQPLARRKDTTGERRRVWVLVDLIVRRRLELVQMRLPIRHTYTSYGGTYVVSASEDKTVTVYSLSLHGDLRCTSLQHHKSPVLSVALSPPSTLLVSGDTSGNLAFWRRLTFTQQTQSTCQSQHSLPTPILTGHSFSSPEAASTPFKGAYSCTEDESEHAVFVIGEAEPDDHEARRDGEGGEEGQRRRSRVEEVEDGWV